jgi:hypothetical protein
LNDDIKREEIVETQTFQENALDKINFPAPWMNVEQFQQKFIVFSVLLDSVQAKEEFEPIQSNTEVFASIQEEDQTHTGRVDVSIQNSEEIPSEDSNAKEIRIDEIFLNDPLEDVEQFLLTLREYDSLEDFEEQILYNGEEIQASKEVQPTIEVLLFKESSDQSKQDSNSFILPLKKVLEFNELIQTDVVAKIEDLSVAPPPIPTFDLPKDEDLSVSPPPVSTFDLPKESSSNLKSSLEESKLNSSEILSISLSEVECKQEDLNQMDLKPQSMSETPEFNINLSKSNGVPALSLDPIEPMVEAQHFDSDPPLHLTQNDIHSGDIPTKSHSKKFDCFSSNTGGIIPLNVKGEKISSNETNSNVQNETQEIKSTPPVINDQLIIPLEKKSIQMEIVLKTEDQSVAHPIISTIDSLVDHTKEDNSSNLNSSLNDYVEEEKISSEDSNSKEINLPSPLMNMEKFKPEYQDHSNGGEDIPIQTSEEVEIHQPTIEVLPLKETSVQSNQEDAKNFIPPLKKEKKYNRLIATYFLSEDEDLSIPPTVSKEGSSSNLKSSLGDSKLNSSDMPSISMSEVESKQKDFNPTELKVEPQPKNETPSDNIPLNNKTNMKVSHSHGNKRATEPSETFGNRKNHEKTRRERQNLLKYSRFKKFEPIGKRPNNWNRMKPKKNSAASSFMETPISSTDSPKSTFNPLEVDLKKDPETLKSPELETPIDDIPPISTLTTGPGCIHQFSSLKELYPNPSDRKAKVENLPTTKFDSKKEENPSSHLSSPLQDLNLKLNETLRHLNETKEDPKFTQKISSGGSQSENPLIVSNPKPKKGSHVEPKKISRFATNLELKIEIGEHGIIARNDPLNIPKKNVEIPSIEEKISPKVPDSTNLPEKLRNLSSNPCGFEDKEVVKKFLLRLEKMQSTVKSGRKTQLESPKEKEESPVKEEIRSSESLPYSYPDDETPSIMELFPQNPRAIDQFNNLKETPSSEEKVKKVCQSTNSIDGSTSKTERPEIQANKPSKFVKDFRLKLEGEKFSGKNPINNESKVKVVSKVYDCSGVVPMRRIDRKKLSEEILKSTDSTQKEPIHSQENAIPFHSIEEIENVQSTNTTPKLKDDRVKSKGKDPISLNPKENFKPKDEFLTNEDFKGIPSNPFDDEETFEELFPSNPRTTETPNSIQNQPISSSGFEKKPSNDVKDYQIEEMESKETPKVQSSELKEKIFKSEGIQTLPSKNQNENLNFLSSEQKSSPQIFQSNPFEKPNSFPEVEKKPSNDSEDLHRVENMVLESINRDFEELLKNSKNTPSSISTEAFQENSSVMELFPSNPRTNKTTNSFQNQPISFNSENINKGAFQSLNPFGGTSLKYEKQPKFQPHKPSSYVKNIKLKLERMGEAFIAKDPKVQYSELKEKIFKSEGIQTLPSKNQNENLNFLSSEQMKSKESFQSANPLNPFTGDLKATTEDDFMLFDEEPEVDVNSMINEIERAYSPINLNVESFTKKSNVEEISVDSMMEESHPIVAFDPPKRDFVSQCTETLLSPLKSNTIQQDSMNDTELLPIPIISSTDSSKKDELVKVGADELDEVDPKIFKLIEKWEPEKYDKLSIGEKIQFREEEMRNYRQTIKEIIEEEKTNRNPATFIAEYKVKKITFYRFQINSRGHSSNLSLKNCFEVLKSLKNRLEPKPEMDTKTKMELLLQRHEECVYQTLTFDQKIGYLRQKLIKIENDINQIIQNEKETFRGKRNENGVMVYKFEGKSRGYKESKRLEYLRHKLKWEIKMGSSNTVK